jgi:hypothetical protein
MLCECTRAPGSPLMPIVHKQRPIRHHSASAPIAMPLTGIALAGRNLLPNIGL